MSKERKQMDQFLTEIYKEYVVVKDEDYQKSLKVFEAVIKEVKEKMAAKCSYFKEHSKEVLLGGSVNDRIKITKMNEFDVDIVIKLPNNYKQSIDVEPDQSGFVRLKAKKAFTDKVPGSWMDSEQYLQQDKFWRWMRGVVESALSDMSHRVENVADENFLVKFKQSGPACTLLIENERGSYKLDVDLVPVLKFDIKKQWPSGRYEKKFQSKLNYQLPFNAYWLAVPKPNRCEEDEGLRNRTWRLSFQLLEKQMMKGLQHLKPAIRLMKKLRDTLKMDKIASYYIKTLFLWKIEEGPDFFWTKSLSDVFCDMVKKFYKALSAREIPYFWERENNLIGLLDKEYLKKCAKKLERVYGFMLSNNVMSVVSVLLTENELEHFKKSTFYAQNPLTLMTVIPIIDQDVTQGNVDITKFLQYLKVKVQSECDESSNNEYCKMINKMIRISDTKNETEPSCSTKETCSEGDKEIMDIIDFYNEVSSADDNTNHVDNEKISKEALIKSIRQNFPDFVPDNADDPDELLRDISGAISSVVDNKSDKNLCKKNTSEESESSDSDDETSSRVENSSTPGWKSAIKNVFNWRNAFFLLTMFGNGPRTHSDNVQVWKEQNNYHIERVEFHKHNDDDIFKSSFPRVQRKRTHEFVVDTDYKNVKCEPATVESVDTETETTATTTETTVNKNK